MLTVWTVCVGDKYTDADVQCVARMVSKHLDRPYRFRCLADRPIAEIGTQITAVDWAGWWQKLYLFHVEKGPAIYLDLDVVVTGSLDSLLSERLSMPANWGQSGYGGCQSSVMAWEGDYSAISDAFDPSRLSEPANGNFGYYGSKRLWGDQEFITDLMGSPGGDIAEMSGVYSYKYHCRQQLPTDAKVVCFHGNPKPNQVSDAWVVRQRST